MRPIVTISGFERGIIQDISYPASNAFSYSQGVDIYTEPGAAFANRDLSAMAQAAATDNITDSVNHMLRYSGNSKEYGLGRGRIYDYNNTSAGKWSLVHTDANTGVGNGMIEFAGNIYWASNAKIGKFTGAAWSDDIGDDFTAGTAGVAHPPALLGAHCYWGDGRYVYRLYDDDSAVASALTLPEGHVIQSMAAYNGKLYMGTKRGYSASMFVWDGFAQSFEREIPLEEAGITAMRVWNNELIVFAGAFGNVYRYNGATLVKIASLPKMDLTINTAGQVYQGSVIETDGRLLFSYAGLAATFNGIYELSKNKSGNYILTIPYYPSDAGVATGGNTFSLLKPYAGELYAAWYNDSGDYGIDNLGSSSVGGSNAYLETQIYDVSDSGNARHLNGVEALMDTALGVDTGRGTVTFHYKIDGATNWTEAGTMKVSTLKQAKLVGINKLARTIQLKAVFNGGEAILRVYKINIY